MGAGAEFKFASCNGWKINLDIDNLVKAEVGLGVTDGKLSNTGANIAETPKNGIYTITLTWKPSAGSVANAFKHTVKLESELPTKTVIKGLGEKENLQVAALDPKKADNDELRAFFGEVLPDFDRDRVYPSDIRKLIQWYNILINAGITDFTVDEEGEEIAVEEKKIETKKPAPQAQVKTQKAAASSARTGVGAKKG